MHLQNWLKKIACFLEDRLKNNKKKKKEDLSRLKLGPKLKKWHLIKTAVIYYEVESSVQCKVSRQWSRCRTSGLGWRQEQKVRTKMATVMLLNIIRATM